jgi:hypothetical protein
MFYDDDHFFTFNHPTNSAQAALQMRDEIEDPGHMKMRE